MNVFSIVPLTYVRIIEARKSSSRFHRRMPAVVPKHARLIPA